MIKNLDFLKHAVILSTVLILNISAGVSIKAAPSKVTKTNDGNIVINNIPTFPLGFYYDQPVDQGAATINTLADAGFNTMYSFTGYNSNMFSTAKQRNLNLMIHWDSFTETSPGDALLGWGIRDDISGPWENPKYTPKQISDLAQIYKNAYPDLLTYSSGGGLPLYKVCEYLTDSNLESLGLQVYPIGNPVSPFNSPAEIVYGSYDYHRRLCPNATLIANLQGFAWKEVNKPTGEWPTTNEVKIMFYSTLMNNFNGIIVWVYRNMAVNKPDVWNEYKSLAQEFQSYKDIMINGTWSSYDSEPWQIASGQDWRTYINGKGRIHASFWKKDNKILMMVNNTSSSQTKSFSIPIEEVINTPTAVLSGSRYPSKLSYSNGNITGSLPPYGVAVYEAAIKEEVPEVRCPGDYTNDKVVNGADFAIFGQNYKVASINCSLDLVGNNCFLNGADFSLFGQVYKKACN